MVQRLSVILRKIRRILSRNEGLVKLFSRPQVEDNRYKKGLIIIQIDGLSQTHFCRAMSAGNMPFLEHLLNDESYKLHTLYSGLPSSTPAVQGELFYGVKNCVPAFSFLEPSTKRIVTMLEPETAKHVDKQLKLKNKALLSGGSSYVNIFSGGAKEVHFCVTSIGWDSLFQHHKWIKIIVFIIANLYSFIRTFALMLIELGLALLDFIRGIIRGRDLFKELKFIPARVGICVLLRELVTIGVKMDAARGLPIIHANYIGYDEQAHRRGPKSKFAHWSLKGIDNAIARIWHSTQRSNYRDYDFWVYSDHGQEEIYPYPKQQDKNVEAAIFEVFEKFQLTENDSNIKSYSARSEQSQRLYLLGEKFVNRLFNPFEKGQRKENLLNRPIVTAMGPIGFVYACEPIDLNNRVKIAKELVSRAHIPLVMMVNKAGNDVRKKIHAWTNRGEFYLPADKNQLLGEDHPFLDDVTNDLIDLCLHSAAGDWVISGWSRGPSNKFSFPIENGAHGGPGAEETRAFALLPADTLLPKTDKAYLRPHSLYRAGLHFRGRSSVPDLYPIKENKSGLRVMTYNVHSCIGMDGKLSPERIARVIAQYQPDIVTLQELDYGRFRSACVDQARAIAKVLSMKFHFHPVLHLEEEQYGNAILTHLPMKLFKKEHFPQPIKKNAKASLEPRGVLWVQVEYQGHVINVLNTHLGLNLSERREQVKTLLGREWLGHPCCKSPLIVCGDFNAIPFHHVHRKLSEVLDDVQVRAGSSRRKKTFSSMHPSFCIDHIFVDSTIQVRRTSVPNTTLVRIASDHLPLITDLDILT